MKLLSRLSRFHWSLVSGVALIFALIGVGMAYQFELPQTYEDALTSCILAAAAVAALCLFSKRWRKSALAGFCYSVFGTWSLCMLGLIVLIVAAD